MYNSGNDPGEGQPPLNNVGPAANPVRFENLAAAGLPGVGSGVRLGSLQNPGTGERGQGAPAYSNYGAAYSAALAQAHPPVSLQQAYVHSPHLQVAQPAPQHVSLELQHAMLQQHYLQQQQSAAAAQSAQQQYFQQQTQALLRQQQQYQQQAASVQAASQAAAYVGGPGSTLFSTALPQFQQYAYPQAGTYTPPTQGLPAVNARDMYSSHAAQPSAKRQALDPHLSAAVMQYAAQQSARQPLSNGQSYQQTSSSLYQQQQQRRAQAAYAAAANNRNNMRVKVDIRNRGHFNAQFQGEDTSAKDHTDEVMRRCEEISTKLYGQLGASKLDPTGGPVRVAETYQQVDQAQLIEACGDTARYLKPYQLVGINFLMLLYRQRIGGAILADEMGLGKTAQVISYLGAIRSLDGDAGPHLVIVTASLLENWQREFARWCPGMRVVPYYGKHRKIVRARLNTLRERMARGEEVDDDLSDLTDPIALEETARSEKAAADEAAAAAEDDSDDPAGRGLMNDSDEDYAGEKEGKTGKAGSTNIDSYGRGAEPGRARAMDMETPLPRAPFDVMLTCYTLFERDGPAQRHDRPFLESWQWSHLIMDEAHALKNAETVRSRRLSRVAQVSRRRVMMTGTPLQNDLGELQNLLHFLLPAIFSKETFENVKDVLKDDTEIAKLTARMKSLLGPFVLRRLKTEVKSQLTEKAHKSEFIPMAPEQQALYEAAVAAYRRQLSARAISADAGAAGIEKWCKSVGARKISHIFSHLRKIAQHPLLVRHHYDDARVEEIAALAHERQLFSGNATLKKVQAELAGYSDYALHVFCYNAGPEFDAYRLSSEHLWSSSKFRLLRTMLPKLKAAGSRPLIFSQWTSVLDVMEWLMSELQLPYVRLDGSTAVEERLATVDKFNGSEEVFAFLLSTRAGGQGLNLTGADTVILHDSDFNPQTDRQAEDRCHRLGQKKPVTVYRFITKGTVDKNIYNIAQRKLLLDAAVLDGITTSTSKHAETPADRLQMGFILHDLLTGKEPEDEDEPKPEDGVAEPKTEEGGTGTPAPSAEVGQAEEVKPEEASKIVEVTETESVP
ncbi:hypothetical protein ACKKBG_A20055 [Auxenochlorella protothecoides x Auxenochlorella symbiontica]